MNYFCRKLALVLALGLSALSANLESASADVGLYVFNLVSVNSSKCLDSPGNRYTESNPVKAYDCNGGLTQQLQIQGLSVGSTQYWWLTFPHPYTQYVLKEGGLTNGSNVVTGSYNVGLNGAWSLQLAADNKWNLVNIESSRCLDVEGTSNGARVQVYDCNGGTAQQFYLEPVPGHYTIRAAHSALCLDVEGNSTNNHARIEQDTCTGGWSQQWKMIPHPLGGDMLVNRLSGKLIDLTGGGLSNGTAIQQYSYANNNNQVWGVGGPVGTLPNGQKKYVISRVNTFNPPPVIDIEGVSTSPGANAQGWQYLGTNQTNQQFTFER